MNKLSKTEEIMQFFIKSLSTGIGFDFSIPLCNNRNINAPVSRKVRWGFSRL